MKKPPDKLFDSRFDERRPRLHALALLVIARQSFRGPRSRVLCKLLNRKSDSSENHPLEDRNALRFAIHGEDEMFGFQTVNKLPSLIENHHISLDQLGVDAQNVIGQLRRRRGLSLGTNG